MQIRIAHENIELTEAIKGYVEEKIGSIETLMETLQIADVMVGKVTNHHGKGDVFHCRVNISFPGGLLRADETADDLYKAIDNCKDILHQEIVKYKDKNFN